MVEIGRPERSARSEMVSRALEACSDMGVTGEDDLPAAPDEISDSARAGLRRIGQGVFGNREQHLRLKSFVAEGCVAGFLCCPQVGFQRRLQPGTGLVESFIV